MVKNYATMRSLTLNLTKFKYNPSIDPEKKLTLSGLFYCQSEIEMETKCKDQCKHCEDYYKPIENK